MYYYISKAIIQEAQTVSSQIPSRFKSITRCPGVVLLLQAKWTEDQDHAHEQDHAQSSSPKKHYMGMEMVLAASCSPGSGFWEQGQEQDMSPGAIRAAAPALHHQPYPDCQLRLQGAVCSHPV